MFERIFDRFKKEPEKQTWEVNPVNLTSDGAEFVAQHLKSIGNPASFGGAVVARRLIDEAAKREFGPTLENPSINPLPAVGIQILIERGVLDLSKENILRVYDEGKNQQ